jgi:hypothetical protein
MSQETILVTGAAGGYGSTARTAITILGTKVYELTGPQSLTMAELAQEFSGALGRTIHTSTCRRRSGKPSSGSCNSRRIWSHTWSSWPGCIATTAMTA